MLEGEEDTSGVKSVGQGMLGGGVGMMNVLAGCITAASAAIVDAGIDCVDLVSGGVAAWVGGSEAGKRKLVLDPAPGEHDDLSAACVVAFLKSRDELTELWMNGDCAPNPLDLIDGAVEAAVLSGTVLAEAVKEAAEVKFGLQSTSGNGNTPQQATHKESDIVMTG